MAGEPAPVGRRIFHDVCDCGWDQPGWSPEQAQTIKEHHEKRCQIKLLQRIATALEKMVEDENEPLTASIPSVWNFPNGSDDH